MQQTWLKKKHQGCHYEGGGNAFSEDFVFHEVPIKILLPLLSLLGPSPHEPDDPYTDKLGVESNKCCNPGGLLALLIGEPCVPT